jgi:outer membrane protein OmpA-like peptidoglycan-associated protein
MDRRVVFILLLTNYFRFSPILSQVRTEAIYLQNPSFEDLRRAGGAPTRWENIGPPAESPPDVQPGFFDVSRPPHHGNSYLGLVVRDNDTKEGVAQRLSSPLLKGQCYKFSLWLCRSELYFSTSQRTQKKVNYITPVKLNIYGGTSYFVRTQLLASSDEVSNMDWREYSFEFKPTQDYAYLIIEADFKKPVLFPYNGNVLVDQASPIVPIKCDTKTLAKINKPKPPVNKPSDSAGGIASVPNKIPAQYDIKPTPSSNTAAYDRKKMKVGQTIRIEKLYFDADSSSIKPACHVVLDELFQFMYSNTDVNIEVGGHTNDIPGEGFCDKLSTARARAVADYLILKGIHQSRVQYKGYGKRQPLFPNSTHENRKRNQRVEIKILSIG